MASTSVLKRGVSQVEAATFRDDGVVCLRAIFDSSWIGLLRDAVEEALAKPGPLAKEYGSKNSGRFFGDYNMWKRFPAFRRFSSESPIAEAAAKLMGARTVRLYNEQLLVKEPGSSDSPTPWHQDLPYFRLSGWQLCSAWASLDSATRETGVMSFVKGSHRWGKMFRPLQFRSGQAAETSDEFVDLPDIDADPERFPVISYDLEPGDCTVHHALTLHSAGGNRSSRVRRRALSIRYAGDDVRWYARAFSPQEAGAAYVLLDADVTLTTGEPLGTPWFPQVWPRP